MIFVLIVYACFYMINIVTGIPLESPSNNERLPSLRLSRRDVQELRDQQVYPAGFVHGNVTFGVGVDAITVDIVEADYNILLPEDDEDGIKARSLSPRGSCLSFAVPYRSCIINYCWKATDQTTYSESITIAGSDGQSNPRSVISSSTDRLSFNQEFNDGYNHWFAAGHECSNHNTMIYTNHRMQVGVQAVASVDHVRCDNCNFGRLNCQSGSPLRDNLIAYSNGVSSQARC